MSEAMDLKTNKDVVPEEDYDIIDVSMDSMDSMVDSMAPNVRSLKMFFQNQKQPIIGFKQTSDNRLETSSQSLPQNTLKSLPNESSDTVINRANRMIPRPPEPIQSSDIKVSPFLQSLVNQRPVPMPRKSLQKFPMGFETNDNSNQLNVNQTSKEDNLRTNSLILSITKELNGLNVCQRNPRTHSLTHSLNYLPKMDQNFNEFQSTDQTVLATNEGTIDSKSLSSVKQTSSKPKRHFKSFLKRSKLLSLRRSAQNSDKHKIKKCQINDISSNVSQMRPIKPTRNPPPPPVLKFRPPAPLPMTEINEDYYEDTLTANIVNPTASGYELYNDSVETEQIYCSLDNEDQSDGDYEGVDHFGHYDDGLTDHKYSSFEDNYYEESIDNYNSDCNRIYEVLPFERDLSDSDSIGSNASTISLDNELDNIESNKLNENPKSDQKLNTFERKRNLKAIKLKKKFNLNGNEIPVNSGVVKEDQKGNRYDLLVRKGETVLILRMEGNPPGKMLAKNERSKIGFVDLDNISFDVESVKSIIKSLATHKP